jgi:hypothetical protein
VLQQKCRDDAGQNEPFAIDRSAQRHSYEAGGGRIRFQYPLDVPFMI